MHFIIGQSANEYDLWLDGTRATLENINDITGDGAFSYDPNSKTLCVRKNHSSSADEPMIRSEIDGLTVAAEGDCVLSAKNTVLALGKNASIGGGGKLTFSSSGGSGVSVTGGAALTVGGGADLTVTAAENALCGASGGEKLILGGSAGMATLRASGTRAIAGFTGGITLGSSWECRTELIWPENATLDGGTVKIGGLTVASDVTVVSYRVFPLRIADTPVDEKNMADILGNGVFSFDGDHTLTVRGSYTTGPEDYYVHIIENSGVDGLVIAAAADSTLKIDPNCLGMAVYSVTDVTITGPAGHGRDAVYPVRRL